MNVKEIREGIVLKHQHNAVEVVALDNETGLVEVRRMDNSECIAANCNELTEDPQLHTDCLSYY